MNTEKMRESIIELLVSTRAQSEGVTADVILSLFARAGGDGEAVGYLADDGDGLYARIGTDDLKRAGAKIGDPVYLRPPAPAATASIDTIEGLAAGLWVIRNEPRKEFIRAAKESISALLEAPAAKVPEGLISNLRALEAHIREEADFNRSWTDGRRGGDPARNPYGYNDRRLEIAAERDEWADGVAKAVALLTTPQPPVQAVPEGLYSIISDLEYAAFNLCERPEPKNIDQLVESTCPEDSLRIAIRNLKALSAAPTPEGE